MTMTTTPKPNMHAIGDRVIISQEAISRGLSRMAPRNRLGTIKGFSRRNEHVVRVLWDGLNTVQHYAEEFVRKATVEEETNRPRY